MSSSNADLRLSRAPFRSQLGQLVRAEGRMLARLASTALLATLVSLALPYASRIALDSALPDASPRLLAVVALAVVALVAHQAWVSWLTQSTRAALSAGVEERALRRVMRALLNCELAALQRRDSGWMTTTLAGASGAVETYVSSFVTLITQSLFALGYFAVLSSASPTVALLMVAFNLAVTAASYALARLESSSIRSMLERQSWQSELLHLLLAGLPSARGHFATGRLGDRWGEAVDRAAHASLKVARVGTLMGWTRSTGNELLSTGFVIWAAHACFSGELTLGELVFLISMSGGLCGSLLSLVGVWTGLRALKPHFDRVDEVLGSSSRDSTWTEDRAIAQTDDAITFENVTFRYPGSERCVMRGETARLARGRVHRLNAPSGSGKSTMLRLIAGLYSPEQGRVRVFGVDAARARRWVLYVPQHCKLLETSIRENLELLSGASLPRLLEIAELTGLSGLLESLPMGLETLVSAEGQNLSSGQRQLLVLTAAFASDRPVLLLDEATSQMDEVTKRQVRWNRLLADRTVVAVDHV